MISDPLLWVVRPAYLPEESSQENRPYRAWSCSLGPAAPGLACDASLQPRLTTAWLSFSLFMWMVYWACSEYCWSIFFKIILLYSFLDKNLPTIICFHCLLSTGLDTKQVPFFSPSPPFYFSPSLLPQNSNHIGTFRQGLCLLHCPVTSHLQSLPRYTELLRLSLY